LYASDGNFTFNESTTFTVFPPAPTPLPTMACSTIVATESELTNAIATLSCLIIELSADIYITDPVSINSISLSLLFYGNSFTVYGSRNFTSFIIQDCSSISIYDMTIANGGGALNIDDSDVSLFGCNIFNNSKSASSGVLVQSRGGGIFAQYSALLMSGCTVSANEVADWSLGWGPFGGGVYLQYCSSVSFSNNTISGNSVDIGAGGGVTLAGSTDVSFSKNIFFHNKASIVGGGFYCSSCTGVTFSDNIVNSNIGGGGGGGGAYFESCDDVNASANMVYDNTLGDDTDGGGGMYFEECSDISVSNNLVHNNTMGTSNSGGGGGILFSDCTGVSVSDNSVYGNTMGTSSNGGGGGGIHFSDCTGVSGADNSVYDNKAGEGCNGGGVFLSGCTNVLFSENLVSSNIANENGGGLELYQCTDVSLSENKIYSNKAVINGGGIYFTECGDVSMSDNMVYGNKAVEGAGILGVLCSSSMSLWKDMIENNIATNGGGGLSLESCTVEISGIFVSSNVVTNGNGGGIALKISSDVTIENSTMSNNSVSNNGGGVYIVGDSSFIGCQVEANIALFGGGIYIDGGNLVDDNSNITNNSAASLDFAVSNVTSSIFQEFVNDDVLSNLNSLNCGSESSMISGGCFYSSNYPNQYNNEEACQFTMLNDGTLSVEEFDPSDGNYLAYDFDDDFLMIRNLTFSGTNSPNGLEVYKGERMLWYKQSSRYVPSSFKICATIYALGGGIYIDSGSADLYQTIIAQNTAFLNGGGMYVTGGATTLEDVTFLKNAAVSATDIWFDGGTMSATNLNIFDYTLNNSFAGDSVNNFACKSNCIAGQNGVCIATTSSDCFINCGCADCPAGTFFETEGSTQLIDCESCGSGKYSGAGSSTCSICPKGTYAANSSTDTGGGLIVQIFSGATSCNDCPAGYLAPATATVVCQACPSIYYSSEGSFECTSCLESYYYDNADGECYTCPEGSSCDVDGTSTIDTLDLDPGHWRTSSTATFLYNCPLDHACIGGTDSSDYCENGYTGPLCALCASDYYFDIDQGGCRLCTSENSTVSANLVVFICILFCFVLLGAILQTRIKNYFASFILSFVAQGEETPETLGANMIEQYTAEGYTVKKNQSLITFFKGTTTSITGKRSKETDLSLARVGSIQTVVSRQSKGYTEVTTQTVVKVGEVDETMLSNMISKFQHKAKSQFKALTSFFQIAVNISFNCTVIFTPGTQKLMDRMSLINFDILSSFSLVCEGTVGRINYIDKMLFVTIVPLLIVALLPLVSFFIQLKSDFDFKRKFRNELKGMKIPDELAAVINVSDEQLLKLRETFVYFDKDGSGSFTFEDLIKTMRVLNMNPDEEQIKISVEEADVNGDGEIDFGEFTGLLLSKSKQGYDTKSKLCIFSFDTIDTLIKDRINLERRNFSINIILIISFLVLVSTSNTLFHYFKCHDFADSRESYMYLDYSISCHSTRYLSYTVFAGFMILIYPIGIPAMYFTLLYLQRDVLGDQTKLDEEEALGYFHIGHLVFLFDAYTPQFYWFEVLECFRRLILASVVGIISADAASSAVVGILASTASSYIMTWEPFIEKQDNFLGLVLAYSLILLFLAALMLKVHISPEETRDSAMFDVLLSLILLSGPVVILHETFVKVGYGALKTIGCISWFNQLVDNFLDYWGLKTCKKEVDDKKEDTTNSLRGVELARSPNWKKDDVDTEGSSYGSNI